MPAVRAVATRLAKAGHLEILQRGVVVDPDNFKGPIRLRLNPQRDASAMTAPDEKPASPGPSGA